MSNKTKGDGIMVLFGFIKRAWGKIRMWREIARQRSQLRRFSEYLAKDIGISRVDAEREADRHFWDYQDEGQAVLQVRRTTGKAAAEQGRCCPQP